MTGIYKITNKINGKFYIGQSVDIERRFMEHKTPHGTITSIKLAMRKYGKENFLFEVIEECSEEDLDEREMYWIATLKPQYNRCSGGTGSKNHHVSEETRAELSQKSRAYWDRLPDEKKQSIINNLSGHPIGYSPSEETKQKLRAANLGKKQSIETIEKRKETFMRKKANGYVQTNSSHKKKVICKETRTVYESVKAVAESIGCTASHVTHCLKDSSRTCKGFHFEYVV
jgi:group I intron endonuclease